MARAWAIIPSGKKKEPLQCETRTRLVRDLIFVNFIQSRQFIILKSPFVPEDEKIIETEKTRPLHTDCQLTENKIKFLRNGYA